MFFERIQLALIMLLTIFFEVLKLVDILKIVKSVNLKFLTYANW